MKDGPPPPELLVFLREVRERPEDDLALLVLGDWLQDQGNPRGELVHLQVMRARLGPDDPQVAELLRRERQLLHRHALDWLGPLANHASSWYFEHGMVQLGLRAERFLSGATEALAESAWGIWVNELTLCGLDSHQLVALARSAWLPLLTALRLPDGNFGPEGMVALASSAYLSQLRELYLIRSRIAADGADALIASPHLHGLRALYVGGNGLSQAVRQRLKERFGAVLRE
jgi:uncharacterized protein (TIGR02996 family)